MRPRWTAMFAQQSTEERVGEKVMVKKVMVKTPGSAFTIKK